MCKKGGFRCANHLSTKIKNLEKVEDKTIDQEAELRELKYAYYGTRTGQKELDKNIEKAENSDNPEHADRLKRMKNIASMLREEEARQHKEAEAKEAKEQAQAKAEEEKPAYDANKVFAPGFDMDNADPKEFDSQFEKTMEERDNKITDFGRFYNSKIQYEYNQRMTIRKNGYTESTWKKSDEEVREELKNDPSPEAAEIRKEYSERRKEIREYEAATDALNKKFGERGGWNRAFLATSGGDGHVHKSMGCSTCNKGKNPTQFKWMTSYSGQGEGQIVQDAGYRACTVCYPSAPVGDERTLPTKMFSDEEIEKAEARKEREAKAKEKAEKAVSNAATLSGEPLRVGMDRFKTERTAVTGYTDRMMYHLIDKAENDSQYKGNPNFLRQQKEESLEILTALAEKKDVSIKELQEELKPKLMTKIKKHNRDRLKPSQIELINNLEHRDGPEVVYEAEQYGLSDEQYNTSPRLWK